MVCDCYSLLYNDKCLLLEQSLRSRYAMASTGMLLENRIKRSITQRGDDVFVRSEFARFGSPAQISRVLRHLVESGRLVKLGVGIYAKTKPSVLTGKAIPVRPVDVLAPIALQKLGVTVSPTQLGKAYNAGETTQIPAGTVINTGKRRISRRIGFGDRVVTYETAAK